MAIISGAIGVLTWTLLEYLLHRFLGHHRRTMPNFFSREHTRHHSEGDYFAPAWKKTLVAAALGAVLLPAAGLPFTIGFVAMYVAYEVVHRRAHVHAGIGPYGRWLRRHHFHHHFANPHANHGVTSPLWDLVFGTLETPARTRVPRKLAMRWLRDPTTGEVWPRFADWYEVR